MGMTKLPDGSTERLPDRVGGKELLSHYGKPGHVLVRNTPSGESKIVKDADYVVLDDDCELEQLRNFGGGQG